MGNPSNRSPRSDSDLIIASRDDPDAFSELYQRWAHELAGYFYRRTFDAELTADLVAETFAVAYMRRFRFRDWGRPGAAWLYGIARRELGQYLRKREVEGKAIRRLGLEIPLLDDESIERIEDLADANAMFDQVTSAMQTLSAREKRVIALRFGENLDYEEVARGLGCSRGAARVALHRALTKLANSMEQP